MSDAKVVRITWCGKAVGDLAAGEIAIAEGGFMVEWFLDDSDKVKMILSSFMERGERAPMIINGQAIYFRAIYDNGRWRSAGNLIGRELGEATEWIKGENGMMISEERASQASFILSEAAEALSFTKEGRAVEAVGRINILNGPEGNVKGVLDLLKNPGKASGISQGSLGSYGRYRSPLVKDEDRERVKREVVKIFSDKEVLSTVLKHPDAGVRRRAIMVVGDKAKPLGRRI